MIFWRDLLLNTNPGNKVSYQVCLCVCAWMRTCTCLCINTLNTRLCVIKILLQINFNETFLPENLLRSISLLKNNTNHVAIFPIPYNLFYPSTFFHSLFFPSSVSFLNFSLSFILPICSFVSSLYFGCFFLYLWPFFTLFIFFLHWLNYTY